MLLPKKYIRHLLHAAMLLMVLSGIGHIHSHRCLDGQEPAQLVHFENFKGHSHHEADAAHGATAELSHALVETHHDADELHNDVENELMPEGLLYKLPDVDTHFVLLTSLLLVELLPPVQRHYVVDNDDGLHHYTTVLLPPLRAPPVLQA
ncbi:MAG: hypothetical protein V4603_09445 [Pseudomonadota bacterium]